MQNTRPSPESTLTFDYALCCFFSSICEAFGVHILLPYEAQIVPPTAAAKASQYVVAHSPSIMGNQEDEVRVELARGRGCCVVMLTWVFPKIDASQFAVCA